VGQGYRVPPGQLEWIMDNQNVSGDYPSNYTMHAGYIRWAPLLTSASCFRYIYAKKETALSEDGDLLGRIKDEHADLIALYAAFIAYGRIGANTAWLETRLKNGLLQMRSDVRGSDPVTVPQIRID